MKTELSTAAIEKCIDSSIIFCSDNKNVETKARAELDALLTENAALVEKILRLDEIIASLYKGGQKTNYCATGIVEKINYDVEKRRCIKYAALEKENAALREQLARAEQRTKLLDLDCDGCEKLRGRHCMLSSNHCIRRGEDYYAAQKAKE